MHKFWIKDPLLSYRYLADTREALTFTGIDLTIRPLSADTIVKIECQLIKLHEQKDYQEFRTVTGGVLHTSGGATRDLLKFEGTKVASRTFTVNLPTPGAREYGFLPPGAFVSSHSSGSLGKMYTFRISE